MSGDPWSGLDWGAAERPARLVVRHGDREIRVGDTVVLRPSGRADILDIALAGRTATVESIEQDYGDRLYLAVVVDDDPGRDLGMQRQPGHRFFFAVEDVEPVAGSSAGRPEQRDE